EQRQDDAKEVGVTFQAFFLETGQAEVFRNGTAQPLEPLTERVSRPLSFGHCPCLALPSNRCSLSGPLPPELSSARHSRSAFARVAFGTHRHARGAGRWRCRTCRP